MTYADIILPLAIDRAYTYLVPEDLLDKLHPGVRVEVSFGKRRIYSGLVYNVHRDKPAYRVRPIVSVLDEHPVVDQISLQLWSWMAEYYACGLGEVMLAALPSRLKLQSDTIVLAGMDMEDSLYALEGHHATIAKTILAQDSVSIDKIREILQIQSVYPYIKDLLDAQVITIAEELNDGYKPKLATEIVLIHPHQEEADLTKLFECTKNAAAQTRAVLALIDLMRDCEFVLQADLVKQAGVTHSVIAALEKKGIVQKQEREMSRIRGYDSTLEAAPPLSDEQTETLQRIAEIPVAKPILLHGVTGSGKTRVYVDLIQKVLSTPGQQVLYLVPEIALTTQLVSRLEVLFGDDLLVYHSRMGADERVEVWMRIREGGKLVLGARSALFLPFEKLGLIIVDEEHDGSYKQDNPAPRYQARDSAVYLAYLHSCRIILGSATPSLESFHNSAHGKYHRLVMEKRYGDIPLPEVVVADLRMNKKNAYFSDLLLDEIEQNHQDGFQTILFQNRRGFAPVLMCSTCGWHNECKNCDTTLVYHKYKDLMQCHLCGFSERPTAQCPSCGDHELTLKGFGTETIEDELRLILPEYRIGRMDLDTARGKKKLSAIIAKFEDGDLDILVGTQMVAKGLDFSKVGLVGIISADQLLHYPDFRAAERAFQLMVQVSGRAGRKHRRGRVVIQAYQLSHPVIADVLTNNYDSFFQREILERQDFNFPPYVRLIYVTVRHGTEVKSEQAAFLLAQSLHEKLGDRVYGPIKPTVARVRNKYVHEIVIKLEKDPAIIARTKSLIKVVSTQVKKRTGLSTTRISVNVDP